MASLEASALGGEGAAEKCGPGYIGPFKSIATMYVSHKRGDKGSYSTATRKQGKDGKWDGKWCDKDGAKDEPGRGGTSTPSAQRFGANPQGGWVMGAVPQNSKYYLREYKILSGGPLAGQTVRSEDHIGGTLNPQAVEGSPIAQIDFSTDCDTLEKNKQGVIPIEVCVKDPGGTPGGLAPGPARHKGN